jgi:hypothetical protein
VHFVAQNHISGKSDSLTYLGGLSQRSFQQLFLGPGVANRSGYNAQTVLLDEFGRLSIKPQPNFANRW